MAMHPSSAADQDAQPWLCEGHPLHPLYAPILAAPADRPYVLGQLGQSLDGRIATASGSSHFINGEAALDHLHRLRALVDAVVVGIGTVIADDCRLTVRRVLGRNPARVIVDPRGRMPDNARCLADDGAERLVLRIVEGEVTGATETIRLPATDGRLAPRDIVAALAARGHRLILIEGGAQTVSAFIADGALDRLHVLVAPVLIGSGQPGLLLPAIEHVGQALRPLTAVHPLAGGDVLFDCDLRSAG